ncbi:hypothetical protein ACEYYB_08925 [Paracoccus sp. p4-l81]|uniref:hypothetical protein n=1 Tax=Paracoccus sp. p4-l81 TaxID=3342806 RepID=UPI0035B7B919
MISILKMAHGKAPAPDDRLKYHIHRAAEGGARTAMAELFPHQAAERADYIDRHGNLRSTSEGIA